MVTAERRAPELSSTLTIRLDDSDYDCIKTTADRAGTEVETWIINTLRDASIQATIVEPHPENEDENGWPIGFIESTYGSLADDPLERLPQGNSEARDVIGVRTSLDYRQSQTLK